MSSFVVKCPACSVRNRISDSADSNRRPVCGKCGNALPGLPQKPLEVTDANFAETVGQASLPVVLDLWAPWCGPCRLIGPIIEELSEELAGKALVGKLNTDLNRATAAKFNVQGIPTILFLKNGREVDRIVGAADKATIRRRFEAIS